MTIPRGTAPHVFVEDLDRPELDGADLRHLRKALRRRSGDALTLADGKGRWRPAVLGPDDVPEQLGPIAAEPRRTPAITIGFALVKGARPELVVQKLTELGVDRIVPFEAERSVVHWDAERARHHAGRLRRVAREAAMQSRRCWLPAVDPVTTFAALAADAGTAVADPDGATPSLAHPTLLVGPEGGWSEVERAQARHLVALGDHVLRAETAAIVAGTLLTALRADRVRST